MADISPGTMLGGYRVEQKLGEGGMGAVYAVIHPVIGKRAAAKVIHETAIKAPQATERFIQEARLVNAIRHPNLVDVFGFATFDDGRPVLILELLEGETLRDRLARGRLPPDEAVQITLQVLDGLGAAHRAGVVHRDMKPDNLFLTKDAAGRLRVKILDFGIAKLLEREPTPGKPLTDDGYWVGTPEYMSPEQCRGGAIDGRADLYAVGLILFEMLVGGRPFSADSAGEYVGQHLYVAPPSIRQFATDLDQRFADLVSSLLAKDPSERPPSAEALAKRLRELPLARESVATSATLVAASSTLPEHSVVAAPTLGVTPVSAPTEENRLCTVLAVELVATSEGQSVTDAEELTRAMEVCLGAISERIEKRGGRVDRVTEEGLMAAFGVPRSTDNDAERAVLAALELGGIVHRALAQSGRERTALGVLAGLETGVVFSGNLGGRATRRDLTIVGEPVTAATSLCSNADEGSVLVGRGTHRHTSSLFTFEEGPAIRVRGTAKRVASYRIAGRRRPAETLEIPELYGVATPLTGRKADLNRLVDAMDQCFDEERSRLVTVLGAPGVGKSRLLAETHRVAEERGDFVFTIAGRATPAAHEGAYDLVAQLVRSRFGIHHDDPREVVERKLRAGIRWLAGFSPPRLSALPPAPGAISAAERAALQVDPEDVGDAIEVLLDLLTLGATDEPVISESVAAPSRSRVAAAIAKLVGLVSTKAPVLVLCDGLELADDPSLNVLDYLVTRLPDSPLFVLGFARPRLLERRPHWGEASRAHDRWHLEPLSRRRTADLARALLSRARAVSDGFVAKLVDRADGNPLVLEETVRTLVDAGVIDRSGDAWEIREERIDSVELPPTVYGLVQARLDRLPDDARALLQRAAVVGPTFWRGALESMDYDGASATSVPDWLTRTLDSLRAKDLVRVRETSMLPDEREYVFTDSAIAEVAYRALSKKARDRHHRAVALWLERFGSVLADANPALLAFHHDRGGNAPEAFRYNVRAGRRAAAMGQNEAALSHWDRALALGGAGGAETGDTRRSVEQSAARWADRFAVRVERGDTLRRIGSLDEAREAYETARASLAELERERGGPPSGSETSDALIDFRLGLVEKARGAHSEALDDYRSALVLLDTRAPSALQVEILVETGFSQTRTGDFAEALRSCRKGLDVCQKLPVAGRRSDLVARLLYTMGVCFYHQRELVRAERFYRQGARLAKRCGDPHLESVGLNNLAAVAFEREDFAKARELFLQSLVLKERLGDLFDLVVAYNNLAEVSLKLGSVSAAVDQSQRALSLAGSFGEGAELADVHRNAAEAALAAGRTSDALAHARRAVDFAMQPSGRLYLGPCATTLARCIHLLGTAPSPPDDGSPDATDAVVRWARRVLPEALAAAGLTTELETVRELLARKGRPG